MNPDNTINVTCSMALQHVLRRHVNPDSIGFFKKTFRWKHVFGDDKKFKILYPQVIKFILIVLFAI